MFRVVAAAKRKKSSTARGARKRAPRKRVPERTRAQLVDSAAALFLEQGLDAPSLDAICEHAGYTRGAFYVHFGSRDEIIGAVVEKTLTDFLEGIVGDDDEEFELSHIIDSFVVALLEGRFPLASKVRASQVLEACARSWELKVKFLAVVVRARQRIAETIRRSQSRSSLRADARPEALADLLLGLVLGAQVAAELGAPYDARLVQAEVNKLLAPQGRPREPDAPGGSHARKSRK